MIQSMTGFGRGEANNDSFQVTVEIKSVNHRFKDIRFKMSSIFSSLELDLKKQLGTFFKRGSFDIYINYKIAEKRDRFEDLDEEKIKKFVTKISGIVGEQSFSPTDFLRSEFYRDTDLSKDQSLLELVKSSFSKALENLKASRLEEGQKMGQVLKDHQRQYNENYQVIVQSAASFQEDVSDRLKKRFQEYGSDLKVDEPRFMQEVIYYLEKIDVHEEINRIQSHLEKLSLLLEKGGEVGRQIDFLIQELGRETNTIGSKSSLKDISDRVVQMKVQLEKIREQGLNLE